MARIQAMFLHYRHALYLRHRLCNAIESNSLRIPLLHTALRMVAQCAALCFIGAVVVLDHRHHAYLALWSILAWPRKEKALAYPVQMLVELQLVLHTAWTVLSSI